VRIFFLLILGLSLSFACSGDCITCHKALKKQINTPEHEILKTCLKCHQKLGKQISSACGGDCFSCHSKKALLDKTNISAHSELVTCNKCHFDKEEIFNSPNSTGFNFNLKDFLKNSSPKP